MRSKETACRSVLLWRWRQTTFMQGCKWGERRGTPFPLAFSQGERRSAYFAWRILKAIRSTDMLFLFHHPNFIYGTLSLLISLVSITKLGVLKKTVLSGCYLCIGLLRCFDFLFTYLFCNVGRTTSLKLVLLISFWNHDRDYWLLIACFNFYFI